MVVAIWNLQGAFIAGKAIKSPLDRYTDAHTMQGAIGNHDWNYKIK